MSDVRLIIEEKRTIGGKDYCVALAYLPNRKKFSASVVEAEFKDDGIESMPEDIKSEYLPMEKVARFSNAVEAQARSLFEAALVPLFKQVFEEQLSRLTSEDFGAPIEGRRYLTQPFVSSCSLVGTDGAELIEGCAKGEIDGEAVELFLHLQTWKRIEDSTQGVYTYLVSAEAGE